MFIASDIKFFLVFAFNAWTQIQPGLEPRPSQLWELTPTLVLIDIDVKRSLLFIACKIFYVVIVVCLLVLINFKT